LAKPIKRFADDVINTLEERSAFKLAKVELLRKQEEEKRQLLLKRNIVQTKELQQPQATQKLLTEGEKMMESLGKGLRATLPPLIEPVAPL